MRRQGPGQPDLLLYHLPEPDGPVGRSLGQGAFQRAPVVESGDREDPALVGDLLKSASLSDREVHPVLLHMTVSEQALRAIPPSGGARGVNRLPPRGEVR